MDVTSGLCGVNEFHDEVSGLCGHCSDICRDIAKPDSFCLYHCSDYYSRLLSTTATSLQKESITLFVTSVLVVTITFIMVIVVITCCCRHRHFHKLKRHEYHGRRNTAMEFTVSGFRRRHSLSHHSSVQETRDPNKQEDVQLSALCMSPCSSLVLAADPATERIGFKALVHDQLYQNRGGSRHQVTINANVSAQDMLSSSEFEETQPKIACDIESGSLLLHDKVYAELAKNLSDDEETHHTSKIQSRLGDKDTRKHFCTDEELRLGFQHSGLDYGENLCTPVQESHALVSYKSGPS